MAYLDLHSFVSDLRKDGDLYVVDARVDARWEVAEIHRRVIAAGGPALLFTNVGGSRFPLVTNLFGTASRAERAFGKRPRQFVERAVELVRTLMPPTAGKLWAARNFGRQLLSIGLKSVRKGPVTEVSNASPVLSELPALTLWPEDGGPFITLPLVYTEHPEGKGHNLGMYRLQIHDDRHTGMHWQIGKGGGFHYHLAEGMNKPLPVTVFLGGPPALILSAIAPLPENVPELMLASLLAGRKLPMVQPDSGHRLISTAEFALVGNVPPTLRAPEGPFGDHYGYYSLQHDYPVFEVEKIYHRKNAIYPATVVGKPRQEDFFIGDLLQELLSPLFPLVMPSVVDLWSYGETGYHSLAAARVQDRYAREAMVSAFRILGEGQLSLTKFLLLTDGSVNLRDFPRTLEWILERTQTETDLYIFANLSMDTLDYTGPRVNRGSKGVWMGLGDPVRKLPTEFGASRVPQGVKQVRVFCPGCLVLGGPSYEEEPGAGQRIVRDEVFAGWPLLILSDEPERAVASSMNFLWTTFTRFEPASDVHARDRRILGNHIAMSPPILIDARMKPGFPSEVRCDSETARTVTERWNEYFPEGMEMGDSERGHLS